MEIIKEQNVESFNVSCCLLFYKIHQLCINEIQIQRELSRHAKLVPNDGPHQMQKHTVVNLLQYYFAECGNYYTATCIRK